MLRPKSKTNDPSTCRLTETGLCAVARMTGLATAGSSGPSTPVLLGVKTGDLVARSAGGWTSATSVPHVTLLQLSHHGTVALKPGRSQPGASSRASKSSPL